MRHHDPLHAKARERGVHPLFYWLVRAFFQPFAHLYFRIQRIGLEHVPRTGPVIYAANHRSFIDPFAIGLVTRRPIYYVSKRELFSNRLVAWFVSSLGAFPVDRGMGDAEMIATAKTVLARGDQLLIFPEGTRVRPGPLAHARRGVGRLALETGAPVVPVAIIGTEAARRGLRLRPHKIRIRVGRPLTFPRVERPSPALAQAVTDRIWPCVTLQWEWLGGVPPIRRAAVVGAGSWGTSVALLLARAGLQVDLGCRTGEQVEALTEAGVNDRYLPGVPLPDAVRPMRARDLEFSGHDLVCFAVPARELPAALAQHGGSVSPRARVLVLAKGLVPPLGSLPSAYVAARLRAASVAVLAGPGHSRDTLETGAALVLASADRGFTRELARLLGKAGCHVETSADVAGVELAAAAKNAAALAASTAFAAGPNAAGAAAGRVFAETQALGAGTAAMAGLAGTGDLVATLLAEGSRNRRAGELLAAGVPAADIQPALGQAAEALDAVPLLAARMGREGLAAPVLSGLAEVIAGGRDPRAWIATLTAPTTPPAGRRRAA